MSFTEGQQIGGGCVDPCASWCGTHSGYARHRCRAEPCKAAARAYKRKTRGSTRMRVMDDDAVQRIGGASFLLDLEAERAAAKWMERGACRDMDPETFFPSRGEVVDITIAICRRCPVREQCLAYAIDNRIHHGIWGGRSERERRRMKGLAS